MGVVSEIQEIAYIDVEADTLNLFDEVEEALSKISAQKPFDAETQSRMATAFLPDRVTATLNMEGIAVSRRQTLAMMDAMVLTENTSKVEIEIYNAFKADEFVFDLVQSEGPLTERAIREINHLIQIGIDESPGEYRQIDVEITGASFQPPAHSEVPDLIRSLVEKYRESKSVHPVLRAVWLHAHFTHIHPFPDGNGRTGRLLQDLSLLYDGYYPTGIPSSRRDDYYDALEQADDGKWDPLCQMVSQFELDVISRVQSIMDEIRTRGKWISVLTKRASEKKSGTLHKQYVVWRQRMLNFVNSTVVISDELNRSSNELYVKSEQFDIVEFKKWKEISETGRSHLTWALKQTWHFEGEPFYRSILYFRRHSYRPEDYLDRDTLYRLVALMFTGGVPQYGVRFEFDKFEDRDIRFRELFFIDDQLHFYRNTGKRREPKSGEREVEVWECESGVEQATVIQGIIEDILIRKLGI